MGSDPRAGEESSVGRSEAHYLTHCHLVVASVAESVEMRLRPAETPGQSAPTERNSAPNRGKDFALPWLELLLGRIAAQRVSTASNQSRMDSRPDFSPPPDFRHRRFRLRRRRAGLIGGVGHPPAVAPTMAKILAAVDLSLPVTRGIRHRIRRPSADLSGDRRGAGDRIPAQGSRQVGGSHVAPAAGRPPWTPHRSNPAITTSSADLTFKSPQRRMMVQSDACTSSAGPGRMNT
jgi:hypothetical protein